MTSYHSQEADARIIIDGLLRQSGWDPADKSQVVTERVTSDGTRADYLLVSTNGRPLAVIEAKKESIDPYTAKEQTLPYAQNLRAPFIFLSNGEQTYFWNYQQDDARLVGSFFSRRDLERMVYLRQQRKPLADVPVPDYYMRQGEQRAVRPYQQQAMNALDYSLELGKRRFLMELPTGTGKTDLICLYLKRLFDAGLAERVLFLVDREQLAEQADGAIKDILNHYSSYWLRAGMARQEQQISVCLLQTMISRHQEFSSGYFDVVVADECHRSIYGAWQANLTHFDAIHIGLTATPADYIERNTFRFYQCKEGEPDFTYSILDAFQDHYLVPYKFATGITVLLTEGADVDEEHYDPAEFERKWTNEDTNRLMMEEFDRLAWESYQDLAPGQRVGPGKAIVFAITKHHAARLARYLNELHPEHHGRYAEVITSDVPDAPALIRRFKYEDYPQVAVSVGMLDTGFDCREVLHLVMCRRIRSPILYQQMRGRGTRTAPHIDKQKFVIYDFFGNHDYFNDSDTDIFTGTGGGRKIQERPRPPYHPNRLIELGLEDEWYQAVSYVEVGPGGERIDKREYITNWERTVQSRAAADPLIQKVLSDQPLDAAEEEALTQQLNQPEMYFNEENLRRAFRQPAGTIIDFIRAALGRSRIKSREEELTENFHAWLVAKAFNPEQGEYLALLKSRGIIRGRIDIGNLFRPPLSLRNAGPRGVELFGEEGLKEIIDDLNEAVFSEEVA